MNQSKETGDTGKPSEPRSAWLGWMLGLLAVPVVYVLTLPPVLLIAMRTGALVDDTPPSPVLRTYMLPGLWLYAASPVQTYTQGYWNMWEKLIPPK